jgi:pyrroloquinoline-quinone synthase
MATSSKAPRVTAHAASIIARTGILQNPYFETLVSGAMSLEQFQETQAQFYFAVVFFSRPMAALVGRIPDARDRLDILHNVLEEHGDMNEAAFHATTFKAFLASIGGVAEPDNLILSPPLRAFNSVLTASCTFDELEVGICCMGVIEMAFADISALIGKAVVDRGWVGAHELVHYRLHAEIDHRHAEEFFRIVERSWEDPQRQYFIKQGLELGVYILDRLYRDLLRL